MKPPPRRPAASGGASRSSAPARHRLTALLGRTLLATPLTVGGQAVIEGVMMRSPKSFAVAVRRRDKSIVVREQPINNFLSRYRVFRWPLVRGAVVLIESLHNGLTALNFAADQAMLDEEDTKGQSPSQPTPSSTLLTLPTLTTTETPTSSKSGVAIWGTLILALALGVGLFVGLPHGLTYLLGMLVPGGLDIDSGWFHLIDGVIKMGIFIAYITIISRLDDIRRLFMYHGAEHKVVHTFEAKQALTVENARDKSTAHPRCGTSLILWVVAISIFMFAAVLPFVPKFFDHAVANHALAILLKVGLTLPVAGLAYELQRFASRHPNSAWIRRLISPGMALQSMTTREPGDAELEVALTALRKVLWREERRSVGDTDVQQHLERFTDFDEVVVKVA